MPPIDLHDPRPLALALALAATAHDFADACADRAEAGGFMAAIELNRLSALAARLVSDVLAWRQALDDLDLARQARLEPVRAGQILVECVFDEALTPAGCRVLAAALDLAWLKRAEGPATASADQTHGTGRR